MLPNAFIEKLDPPTDKDVKRELAAVKPLWDELITVVAKQHGVDVGEWNSYSKKAGWALKLKRGDRTIVYLSPGNGAFLASFALGEKALISARKSGLSPTVLKLLRDAKRYAEGTAVRIEVRKQEDIETVRKLVAAKIAH
jgi:hypothetical protein